MSHIMPALSHHLRKKKSIDLLNLKTDKMILNDVSLSMLNTANSVTLTSGFLKVKIEPNDKKVNYSFIFM